MTASKAMPGTSRSGRRQPETDLLDRSEPASARRLGVIALGALLGSVPAPGSAGSSDTKAVSGVGQLRLRQATTRELSPKAPPIAAAAAEFAEPIPAATLTVTTASVLQRGAEGERNPYPVVAQATRTEFGRPRSSMRLRTSTAMATSAACASSV